jgi:CBS domain-containing protein
MRIDSFATIISGRLRMIEIGATVQRAALALSGSDAGLVVVCGSAGQAEGVISKSDLVRHLAESGSADADASKVMTRAVVSCRPEDEMQAVLQEMTARRLQNVPVLGAGSKPLGVLDIRDAMGVILETEQFEEQELANYIAGIGYR